MGDRRLHARVVKRGIHGIAMHEEQFHHCALSAQSPPSAESVVSGSTNFREITSSSKMMTSSVVLLGLGLLTPAHAYQMSRVPIALHRRSAVCALDRDTLLQVAVYDSEMEARVADLTKQLETKASEVEKFVNEVESSLKEARADCEKMSKDLEARTKDLEARTEEVGLLNAHLEAHTTVTSKLRTELETAKSECDAAKAAQADAEKQKNAALAELKELKASPAAAQ